MTPTEFQAWFPSGEFSSLTDAYVQVFIDRAAPAFNIARWGAWYSEGFAHYTAHFIVVDKARSSNNVLDEAAADLSGNISSKAKGPVKVSYDAALLRLAATDSLYLTPYGRRYCELRKLAGMGGMVVR